MPNIKEAQAREGTDINAKDKLLILSQKAWRPISQEIHLVKRLQWVDICVNDINTFIEQWFTLIGNLAKIEINWLEQWVMSITGTLCHQSHEVLLLQRRKYNNNDLNLTFTVIGAIVGYDLGACMC